MPAPKGNAFWKVRTKHGRDKIFSTPEILWESAVEYFQWCVDNPLIKTIVQGSKIWEIPKMRAMTIEGLCIFLGVKTQTFNDYYNNKDNRYKDYIGITIRIKEIIRTQKFEGAAAGFLNANIIARDLGLKDKHEHDVKDDRKQKEIELSRQAKEISDRIEEKLKKEKKSGNKF